MKYLLLIVSGVLVLGGVANADVIQADISSYVEKDLVYEIGGSADAFGAHAGANQAYLEDGYSSGNGLASSGILASSQVGLGNYQLMAYDANNAIEFSANAGAANETHTIDLPNWNYDQIGLLVGGVNYDVSFTYTINYADLTTETGWWEADDWYDIAPDLRANMNVIVSDMDNVNVSDGTLNDLDHFSMFEFLVTPSDTGKAIDSISVGNDPNRWTDGGDGSAAIFAINGNAQVIPEPTVAGLLGLAAAGFLTLRRRRK